MRTTQALSITLPIEMAEMVKAKVSSGEYASESEVIRDGLRTLAARDAAIEKWLIEEVVPTIDALDKDPSRVRSVAETREELQLYMDGVKNANKAAR
ncbi:type II toxin-antitoxin system ParD family antitoxin [Pararhizobium sp. BT-229]|uniref:ribbon-helix-helix domain-containing protein n=1 Tax=Pararhizobium sp. BT-229 TaxID=2986923 RepID=UPI0021F7AEDE|nr:type II toxin-antitoxin system ParD family antitoxin [Pararhizobium sp. BT-229]MCV9965830.1 type II toxin-antitoxin system ParD family antitoxin [Pararhizobium sp. BT-229]